MREVLFKGKRRDNRKWIEGGFFTKEEKRYIVVRERYMPDTRDCDTADYYENHPTYKIEIIEVIPETVAQFTGLTDKNGKKIFEGDYIVCRQAIQGNFIDEHIEMGYVEMKHGAFGLHRKQGYYRPFKDWLENYEYEVIGNLHDNPELLKGGEEE